MNEALAALEARFRGALRADRAAVDRAGEAAAGDAVAGVLFDPLGAAADGAAGIRPAVPLVRRDRHRGCGLGPFDLLEEPRPAARRRHRGEVPGGGAGAAAGEEAAVDGSLLGRRHADRGVGVDEELQAEGRLGRAAGRAAGATPKRTSAARSARTRRTPRPPIPTPGSTARGRARRRSSASSAMA